MVYRVLIMLLLLPFIESCAAQGPQIKISNRPALMTDIYAQTVGDAQKDVAKFLEENLKAQKTFGYVKPYIPVVQGPVVRKIWVPDHKSQDDASVLVGGHWMYLMLEGPKWFVDGERKDTQFPILVPAKPIEVEKK